MATARTFAIVCPGAHRGVIVMQRIRSSALCARRLLKRALFEGATLATIKLAGEIENAGGPF